MILLHPSVPTGQGLRTTSRTLSPNCLRWFPPPLQWLRSAWAKSGPVHLTLHLFSGQSTRPLLRLLQTEVDYQASLQNIWPNWNCSNLAFLLLRLPLQCLHGFPFLPPISVSPIALLPQQASIYSDPCPGPAWECDPPVDESPYDADSSPELTVISDAEDRHDTTLPVGRSRQDPIHLDAVDVLHQMWHEVPAAIPPIPSHTESSTYYCGFRIHYRW